MGKPLIDTAHIWDRLREGPDDDRWAPEVYGLLSDIAALEGYIAGMEQSIGWLRDDLRAVRSE